MRYRTILLDWHDTLSHGRYWQRWRDDPARVADYARLEATLFGDGAALLLRAMRGQLSIEQACAELAVAVGLPTEVIQAELQWSCEAMTVAPELLDAIAALRARGVVVLIATESTASFRRWTVPALQLDQHTDGLLDSSQIGALKEDLDDDGRSRFFADWLDSWPESASVLLIDNLPQPVADAAGIEVVSTDGPERTLALLRALLDVA
jgi:FMN phosphatase YigB (HAD superfamily)